MIKLYDGGVYLLNGTEIVEDTGNVQVPLSKEEAAQNTMAYSILSAHNILHSSGSSRQRVLRDSRNFRFLTF